MRQEQWCSSDIVDSVNCGLIHNDALLPICCINLNGIIHTGAHGPLPLHSWYFSKIFDHSVSVARAELERTVSTTVPARGQERSRGGA